MSTPFRGVIENIENARQPEYTGENRCVPCTIVNVCIAAALAVGAAFVLVTPIGVALFGACLLVIYLRGYLVPGTPEITKQYFPSWLLSVFGKDAPVENVFDVSDVSDATAQTERERESTETESGAKSETTDDTETANEPADARGPLFAAGVVASDESDEIVLTPSFRAAWRDRIESVGERGVEPADVRATFDADTIRRTGELSFVIDSSASVRWGSRAELVADVAAAAVLRERLASWTDLEKDDRTATLTGLRLFLTRCPTCGGAIAHADERVDPCCQKPHLVVTATCEECGSSIADAAVVDSGKSAPVRVRLLRQ